MSYFRPLPATILIMTLLTGVKTVGLVEAVGIGSPAHANEHDAKPSPDSKTAPDSKTDSKPATEAKPASNAKTATDPKAMAATAAPATAQTAPPACPPAEPQISDAERTALQELRERRKQLDGRATKLDEREALLSAAESRLTDRVQQLTLLQTKLEQLDKERHDRDEANWKGLVKTYETMKPRDAAIIFNDLDNTIMVQVLDRMKEAKAGAILAAMTPERARAATLQLAQWRNQVSAAPRLDLVGAKP